MGTKGICMGLVGTHTSCEGILQEEMVPSAPPPPASQQRQVRLMAEIRKRIDPVVDEGGEGSERRVAERPPSFLASENNCRV
eukprot:5613169-Prymnesium_polylepis.1